VSSNVADYCGMGPDVLLGSDLRQWLEPPDSAALERACATDTTQRAPVHVFCGPLAGRGRFDVITHQDGPLVIVEAEPASTSASAPDFYSFASRTVAGLHNTPNTIDYCQALAAAIRDLSGYDRVMIYRFDDDWSGHVIAESMTQNKGLAPFLDLHYPASDIPAQARAFYAIPCVCCRTHNTSQPA
jgi:two-component system, chemotaxis family, sensor kinase Cph1